MELIGNNILITFDDGFISTFEAADKILDSKNLKGCFFLPFDFIKEAGQVSWKKFVSNNIYNGTLSEDDILSFQQPMGKKQIGYLISVGHAIGSHTNSHCNLSEVSSIDVFNKELKGSKNDLERMSNVVIDMIAYPFGGLKHINSIALKQIKNSCKFCFSNIRGINDSNTNPLAIRRQNILPDMPISYVGFLIEGGLNWYWSNHRKRLDQLLSFSNAQKTKIK